MKSKKTSSDSSQEAYRLVYSTDPIKKAEPQTRTGYSGALKPTVRVERKGRNGKTVTILTKLPPHETLLKDLCAFLKKSLGSGGTFIIVEGAGVIEIQGDHRDQISNLIEQYALKRK